MPSQSEEWRIKYFFAVGYVEGLYKMGGGGSEEGIEGLSPLCHIFSAPFESGGRGWLGGGAES